jgi:hypothetical protein
MYCPQCRAEYREGIERCPQCDVALVAVLPDESGPGEPDAKLVKVYATGEAAMIPVVQSLLESAGIEYLAKGEEAQDLLGFGRLGTNYSYVTGPVEFLVREEDEATARGLLEELAVAIPEDAEAPEPSE